MYSSDKIKMSNKFNEVLIKIPNLHDIYHAESS